MANNPPPRGPGYFLEMRPVGDLRQMQKLVMTPRVRKDDLSEEEMQAHFSWPSDENESDES